MRVGDLTWRKPVTIDGGETIAAAAQKLEDEGVGALVVLDGERPVGIVTDRDIVTRGVAKHIGTDARIDSLMSTGVIALDADEDAEELFSIYSQHAVRRVPVVEGSTVVGMITLDDALVTVANQLGDLAGVLASQISFPWAGEEPPAPALIDG